MSKIRGAIDKLECRADFSIIDRGRAEIPYIENLRRVAETRCVVEVLQEKQQGLSLRALEALFFQKKLLTTNTAVMNADFFRQENVFVFDGEETEQSAMKIRDFLETPCVPVPDEIKQKYLFKTWLAHFAE